MLPECFVFLLLLNIRIVDSMDIRNLLFKDHSRIESTTRSLEASSYKQSSSIQNSSQGYISSSSESTIKIKNSDHLIMALILSNFILIIIAKFLLIRKIYKYIRLKVNKRRKINKKRKRKNIVNNPHSDFFEDF